MRFLIAAGSSPVLTLPEPMLGIPIRYAVLLIGGLELTVALICLFGKPTGLQIGWVAWLTSNFIVYRVSLFTMHCHPQSTCIGSLTDPLKLSRGISGWMMTLTPLYLLSGSYAAVSWLWLENRRAKAAKFIRMSCPACGVHIQFAVRNLGQKIPCPHCQKTVSLRQPELLRMSCFFCQGHIEFPAHAIGEKMPCPHCNMDITLKEPV